MDSRTTTDAVHPRMLATYYTCETCKIKFDAAEIEAHFTQTRSHILEGKCAYCQGPCYSYIDNLNKRSVWHKCPKP